MSNANVSPNSFDLTPCRCKYNGVDIGGTLGNVKVAFKYEKSELLADQLGKTPLDRRISGMMVEVTTEFAEVNDFAKFKAAFPNLDLVTNGSGPSTVTSAIFRSKVGVSDYAQAALLTLHPLNRADVDVSQDFNFFKAFPSEDSEIVYSPTEQMKLKVIWRIYPEQDSGEYRMFVKGDPTNTVVNASHGSAVPGGSNVGNGTVTGISVTNGKTKTETLTLSCVGVPSANHANFDVEGSVSGPLGIAILGTAFVRDQITFTINDGATDFAIGDSFTIATVASNVV